MQIPIKTEFFWIPVMPPCSKADGDCLHAGGMKSLPQDLKRAGDPCTQDSRNGQGRRGGLPPSH